MWVFYLPVSHVWHVIATTTSLLVTIMRLLTWNFLLILHNQSLAGHCHHHFHPVTWIESWIASLCLGIRQELYSGTNAFFTRHALIWWTLSKDTAKKYFTSQKTTMQSQIIGWLHIVFWHAKHDAPDRTATTYKINRQWLEKECHTPRQSTWTKTHQRKIRLEHPLSTKSDTSNKKGWQQDWGMWAFRITKCSIQFGNGRSIASIKLRQQCV